MLLLIVIIIIIVILLKKEDKKKLLKDEIKRRIDTKLKELTENLDQPLKRKEKEEKEEFNPTNINTGKKFSAEELLKKLKINDIVIEEELYEIPIYNKISKEIFEVKKDETKNLISDEYILSLESKIEKILKNKIVYDNNKNAFYIDSLFILIKENYLKVIINLEKTKINNKCKVISFQEIINEVKSKKNKYINNDYEMKIKTLFELDKIYII